MNELENFYRNQEELHKSQILQNDEKKREVWLRIIDFLLPLHLQHKIQTNDSYYMWVDVSGQMVVTWPIVRGRDSDAQCMNLFQNGRLGYVKNWHEGHAALTRYCTPEDLSDHTLANLVSNLVISGGIEAAQHLHCFLQAHWDEPWAQEKRKSAIHLLH